MVGGILKCGDKMDIVVNIGKNKDTEHRTFKSIIYNILKNDDLEVGMPVENGKMFLLPIGLQCELVFYQKNALYTAKAQVAERFRRDNLYMMRLEMKTGLKKASRREYFRYECFMEVYYFKISEEEAGLEDGKDILQAHKKKLPGDVGQKAVTLDISGGGMRFVTKEEMEKGTHILVELLLDDDVVGLEKESLWMSGVILGGKQTENHGNRYEYRMEFDEKNSLAREKIIRYIFEKERKILKNK